MIQITQEKKAKLTDCVEKMLHCGGKLMQMLESLEEEESEMGERRRYNYEDEPQMIDHNNRIGWRRGMRYGSGMREYPETEGNPGGRYGRY